MIALMTGILGLALGWAIGRSFGSRDAMARALRSDYDIRPATRRSKRP